MPAFHHSGSALVRVEFDRLEPPSHSRLSVRPGAGVDLDDVYTLIAKHVPAPYAPIEVFRRILDHHPETLLAFHRDGCLLGFHAALYLSPLGLERLLLGEFDGLSPEPDMLITPAMPPAAIYYWLTICPGLAVEGLTHLAQRLRHPTLARLNLFARPVTLDGERRLLRFGYRPVACGTARLHRYVRLGNRLEGRRQAA